MAAAVSVVQLRERAEVTTAAVAAVTMAAVAEVSTAAVVLAGVAGSTAVAAAELPGTNRRPFHCCHHRTFGV
jgi:hypothetical protein